jgi:transcriptional regulator with XRE-family HTH domain
MVNKLGEYIVRLRKARKLSRAALAKRAGVGNTTLRNIEVADRAVKPDEETLEAIARVLVEPDDYDRVLEEMRVLAGYRIIASENGERRQQRIQALLAPYPHLERALMKLLEGGSAEEIDQAATVLEVHLQVARRRW